MKERRAQKQTVDVPKGAGKAGFLLALESILDLPRVQEIHIDARGKVAYTRFVLDEEESTLLQIDFDSVMPHSVIRNSEVVEIPVPEGSAATEVISNLFTEVANDQLFPLSFVTGVNTLAWAWLGKGALVRTGPTGIRPKVSTLFGLPVYADRKIEDYMLIMCAGHTRNAALVSTQKSYKIVIPTWREVL
jgi:hypothetical protein